MIIKLTLIMILLACALYDFIEFRIPNVLTAAILLLFPVWVVTQRPALLHIGEHLFVGAMVFIGAAALYRFRLIGGGDVKLLSVTCLWAGPYLFLAHLALTSLLAVGLLLLILPARRVYPAVVAAVPRIGAMPVPRLLRPGAGLPYGVAIAASAITLGIPKVY